MAAADIAVALDRARSILAKRPGAGLHDDAEGVASWAGGTRIVASHPDGRRVETDMPTELGGTGDQVSPGWLVRAGVASCAATCIAMVAARSGVELQALEVRVTSRSDTRGVLGMADEDGVPVRSAPRDLTMSVRIAAPGVPAQRLRALVEEGRRVAPMSALVQGATPMTVAIEIGAA
ncbi:MAG: OsmC family protein [Proteobacteria bacterium]|nr:OsmC family protein [Pseudomonadota bacterium]